MRRKLGTDVARSAGVCQTRVPLQLWLIHDPTENFEGRPFTQLGGWVSTVSREKCIAFQLATWEQAPCPSLGSCLGEVRVEAQREVHRARPRGKTLAGRSLSRYMMFSHAGRGYFLCRDFDASVRKGMPLINLEASRVDEEKITRPVGPVLSSTRGHSLVAPSD